ncbi:class I SAM-dependent methyltransferase [Jannaschia sp. Os4]|uniref:class I SAM-dependent methyltransferase n=1 Tax=Jannaschia sp. Os4 TaxID=2807617 RepID=UPI0019395743|nr:class I SAM-dependent methyltransferase [Jannaschia sp. Os4]MBM2576788.1 class I SAM-dependent methyltransferase [Jannaschia sp. Os4]
MWRTAYEVISRRLRDDEATCLNYGYVGPDAPLDPADPEGPNRALYSHVAARLDLRGKAVVEVGSGRGGGAAHVARTFGPARLTGIDIAGASVRAAARIHADVPNLAFRRGDALALPLADGSVDAVLNVESSHCYPSTARFVAEAARVLRPGGRLGLADFRMADDVDALDAALARPDLRLDARTDITDRVLAAMAALEERKRAMIARHGRLGGIAREWAGTEGSLIRAALRDGEVRYLSYVLTKS